MSGRSAQPAGFGADSRGCFEQLLGWLEGGQATGMTHAELEDELAFVAGNCCDACCKST